MSDHLDSPEPHHGPLASLTDEELIAAYKREEGLDDSLLLPALASEVEHRGLSLG